MQMISSNEQEEPWLDEGFTSFFEAKILDKYYPEGVVNFDYFDFSDATSDILSLFPASQNLIVTYYLNENDALAEQNEITNTTDFRNTIPNNQAIWVRLDSNLNNDCVGLGPYLKLKVNPSDTMADYYAQNKFTRTYFYSELEKEKLSSKFNKNYASQLSLVESVILSQTQLNGYYNYEDINRHDEPPFRVGLELFVLI